ncbi:MAG: ankyrin repeat domain-containing protein [Candidatus Brocadiia bacterium]
MRLQQAPRNIVLAHALVGVVLLSGGCAPEGPATLQDFFGAVVKGDVAQVKAGIHHHPEWVRVTDAENYNRTALHKAAGHGHQQIVEFLLAKGADINARDKLGYTPLMFAIHGRKSEVAVWLIEKGARVNVKEKNGYTALHNAAFAGMPKVVMALVRHKAALNAKAGRETPLHLAAREGHVDVARILLENGADANGGSGGFGTPMSLASMGGHEEIVELLKEYGAE